MIYGYKNSYGITVKQLKVDYNTKTYQVGSFTMRNDKTITRKQFYELIEEYKKLGLKEV